MSPPISAPTPNAASEIPSVLLGQFPATRSGLVSRVIGCWSLFDSTGAPPTRLLYAPASARLDSTRVLLGHAPFVYRRAVRFDTLGRDMEDGRTTAMWSIDSLADSVRLMFSRFSGTTFILAVPASDSPDTLHGHVINRWDSGPPFMTRRGSSYAIRIPCAPSGQRPLGRRLRKVGTEEDLKRAPVGVTAGLVTEPALHAPPPYRIFPRPT